MSSGRRRERDRNGREKRDKAEPAYPWVDQELVYASSLPVSTPFGGVVNLICEVRRPSEAQVEGKFRDHRNQFRLRIGRETQRSFDGMSRQLWVDDLADIIDMLVDAYVAVSAIAAKASVEEAKAVVEAQACRLRSRIQRDPNDWRNRLVEFEEARLSTEEMSEDAASDITADIEREVAAFEAEYPEE